MKVSSIAAACLVLVWTATANAQESVEDLTKKGAVRMTAADVKAQIVGFQTEGPVLDNPASIQTRTLKSDGSFEARSTGAGGGQGGASMGQWTVRDDGAICTEGTSLKRARRDTGRCTYFYKLGDQYYIVDAENPSAIAQPRKVIK